MKYFWSIAMFLLAISVPASASEKELKIDAASVQSSDKHEACVDALLQSYLPKVLSRIVGQYYMKDQYKLSLKQTLQYSYDAVLAVAFRSNDLYVLLKVLNGCMGLRKVNAEGIKCCVFADSELDEAYSGAINPNDSQIASGGADKMVRLWNSSTGRCQYVLRGHRHGVTSVVFSHDGQLLASASYGIIALAPPHAVPSKRGIVRVWDVHTRKRQHYFATFGTEQSSIGFSPDSLRFAYSYDDATVRVCEVQTGHCLNSFKLSNDVVGALAFSPQGNQIAVASAYSISNSPHKLVSAHLNECTGRDRHAYVFGVFPSGDGYKAYLRTRQNDDNYGGASAVAFTPDGLQLAAAFPDGQLGWWDTERHHDRPGDMQGHKDWTNRHFRIDSLVFNPDGSQFAVHYDDNTIQVWGRDIVLNKEVAKTEDKRKTEDSE